MQIVILQRLSKDLEKIRAAMEKVCPELLQDTVFFSYIQDSKASISIKKRFLSKREHKDVMVVTGTILMDESVPRAVNKILDWNSKAVVIIYSVSIEFIDNNKKLKKRISKVIQKHVSEGGEKLAEYIKNVLANK